MNIDIRTVKDVATRSANLGLLKIKKHSPVILTAVGIVGSITSTVMACRATLKVEAVVDDLEQHIENVKHLPAVDDKARTVEMAYIYTKHSMTIARLYAPAVSVGIVSIACIASGQGIMQRRNTALVAAYTTLEQGFNEYRKRVEAGVGQEREEELRYGISTEERHDTKAGVVEQVSVIDPNAISPYAKFFDETCPEWTKTPEYNLLFLKAQQQYANDLLKARGHVFLNDVYDMLGFERSSAGSVVGWVISKTGDNYIDFGIYRAGRDTVREFVNGREASILLDFNVDGVIYDKI